MAKVIKSYPIGQPHHSWWIQGRIFVEEKNKKTCEIRLAMKNVQNHRSCSRRNWIKIELNYVSMLLKFCAIIQLKTAQKLKKDFGQSKRDPGPTDGTTRMFWSAGIRAFQMSGSRRIVQCIMVPFPPHRHIWYKFKSRHNMERNNEEV